jgi:ASC-1-like (ASCH) protein
MSNHTLHLNSSPFNKIKNGQKTIESRLDDEKRQELKVGDHLTFINREDEAEIQSTITDLHYFPTFADLFQNLPKRKFADESVEALLQEINRFHSSENEQRWGVVGIEFKINSHNI